MALFDEVIKKIREYTGEKVKEGRTELMREEDAPGWPAAGDRDIVLAGDTALELGGPSAESFSLVIWTNNPGLVKDGLITRIGPDFSECSEKNIPFGKVIITGGSDFDETNSYDRFVEMSLVGYEISLKGYMARTSCQDMREWVRISRRALKEGFSLHTAGGAMLEEYKKRNYVNSAELLAVTSGTSDVMGLKAACSDAVRLINAMRKMGEEMSFDCSTCEYRDVCDQVSELKAIAAVLEKRKQSAGAVNG